MLDEEPFLARAPQSNLEGSVERLDIQITFIKILKDLVLDRPETVDFQNDRWNTTANGKNLTALYRSLIGQKF